jgi:hypothetical protein
MWNKSVVKDEKLRRDWGHDAYLPCHASGKSQLLLVFRQVTHYIRITVRTKQSTFLYSNKSLIHTKQQGRVGDHHHQFSQELLLLL